MKKIFFLLALLLFVGNLVDAQTTIKDDRVIGYIYPDSMEKDDTFTRSYYIQAGKLPVTMFMQFNADTIETGYIKQNALGYGSLDKVHWYLLGDTIELASTGAPDSDTIGYRNNLFNHYKFTGWAVDSTQTTTTSLQISFDVND